MATSSHCLRTGPLKCLSPSFFHDKIDTLLISVRSRPPWKVSGMVFLFLSQTDYICMGIATTASLMTLTFHGGNALIPGPGCRWLWGWRWSWCQSWWFDGHPWLRCWSHRCWWWRPNAWRGAFGTSFPSWPQSSSSNCTDRKNYNISHLSVKLWTRIE